MEPRDDWRHRFLRAGGFEALYSSLNQQVTDTTAHCSPPPPVTHLSLTCHHSPSTTRYLRHVAHLTNTPPPHRSPSTPLPQPFTSPPTISHLSRPTPLQCAEPQAASIFEEMRSMMQFAMMPMKFSTGSKQEQALIDHDRLDSLTQEFKVGHYFISKNRQISLLRRSTASLTTQRHTAAF